LTKKTVYAAGRTRALSTAADSALPGLLAGCGASLFANAECGGRRHCLDGMVTSRKFNY